MGSRARGTVMEYDSDRGFGFIQPDNDMRRQIVVREDELEKAGISTLRKGDRVEFTLVYSERYIPLARDLLRLSS